MCPQLTTNTLKYRTCTQWHDWQGRHVGCAKLPRRINYVTSWNDSNYWTIDLGSLNAPENHNRLKFSGLGSHCQRHPKSRVLPPRHGCYAGWAHVKTKQWQAEILKQSKLAFRFSRFRTFFSTIVRHCFSVISLASDAITLSCCLTQIDGIFTFTNSQPCACLLRDHGTQTTGRRRHCVFYDNRAGYKVSK